MTEKDESADALDGAENQPDAKPEESSKPEDEKIS